MPSMGKQPHTAYSLYISKHMHTLTIEELLFAVHSGRTCALAYISTLNYVIRYDNRVIIIKHKINMMRHDVYIYIYIYVHMYNIENNMT